MIAFATIQNPEIKKLSQAMAYSMFMVAAVRLVTIAFDLNNEPYKTISALVNLIPTTLSIVACQKNDCFNCSTNNRN